MFKERGNPNLKISHEPYITSLLGSSAGALKAFFYEQETVKTDLLHYQGFCWSNSLLLFSMKSATELTYGDSIGTYYT